MAACQRAANACVRQHRGNRPTRCSYLWRSNGTFSAALAVRVDRFFSPAGCCRRLAIDRSRRACDRRRSAPVRRDRSPGSSATWNIRGRIRGPAHRMSRARRTKPPDHARHDGGHARVRLGRLSISRRARAWRAADGGRRLQSVSSAPCHTNPGRLSRPSGRSREMLEQDRVATDERRHR